MLNWRGWLRCGKRASPQAAASPNDRGAWHSFPLGFPEGGIPPLLGELSASALAVKPRLTCTYPCRGPSDLDISKEETAGIHGRCSSACRRRLTVTTRRLVEGGHRGAIPNPLLIASARTRPRHLFMNSSLSGKCRSIGRGEPTTAIGEAGRPARTTGTATTIPRSSESHWPDPPLGAPSRLAGIHLPRSTGRQPHCWWLGYAKVRADHRYVARPRRTLEVTLDRPCRS
jgi:hypothetical protein